MKFFRLEILLYEIYISFPLITYQNFYIYSLSVDFRKIFAFITHRFYYALKKREKREEIF